VSIQDYLTVMQAAREIGVSEGAIRDAIKRKAIPYEEALGRKVIKRSDLDAYKQRTQPNGEPARGRPRTRFDASKGGHAPGPLRDAFTEWVELYEQADEIPLTVQYEDDEKPLKWLLGQLWNCTDVLPGVCCDILEMPHASYATAVRKVMEKLPE
jgi:excisionase family DNA binding protein